MSLRGMWVVALYWAVVLWGSDTPAARHAHIVRPEQSKLPGPAAPHRYGLPIWRCASWMAPDAPRATGAELVPGSSSTVGLGGARGATAAAGRRAAGAATAASARDRLAASAC